MKPNGNKKTRKAKQKLKELKHYEYYYELQEKSKQTNQQREDMGEGEDTNHLQRSFSVDNVNDFGCFRPKQAELFKQPLADDTLFA